MVHVERGLDNRLNHQHHHTQPVPLWRGGLFCVSAEPAKIEGENPVLHLVHFDGCVQDDGREWLTRWCRGQSFTGQAAYLVPVDANPVFITALGSYFAL